MGKGRIKKRIIGIVSLVLAVILFVLLAQEFWLRNINNMTVRMEGFYKEEENSLDVVLMGSSEIYQGYCAAEAYRLYGFTSYPFAFATNPVTLWKYELKEILKHQNPKLIVVEINGSVYGDDLLHKQAAVRYLTDAMPMSRDKVALVREMGEDSEISYYLPFIKYHSKRKFNQMMSVLRLHLQGHSILRGAFTYTEINEVGEEMDVKGDKSTMDLNPLAEEKLREFLEYCKEPGMPRMLFVRFPHQTVDEKTYKRLQRYNRAGEIVEEYGFDYIDLDEFRDEMGILKDEDFYNGEHLNARGARKLTKYLGEILREDYGVEESRLTDKGKEEWDESARYIEKYFQLYEKVIAEGPRKDGKKINLWDNGKTLKEIEKMLSEG